MEIEKFIEKITNEVYSKVVEEIKHNTNASQGSFFAASKYSSSGDIASMIEHTNLKPDVSAEEVKKLCRDAREYRFVAVCVSPWFVPLAAEQLRGSGVKVCTVAGFPYGAASTKAKVAEVREAIENGAEEVDVTMNISALKSGDYNAVKTDLETIVGVARGKAKVKAIVEMSLLNEEEKVKACTIAKIAGADFIKVSNALGTGKACAEEIKFVRKIIGSNMGIKVDGGIKDYDTAVTMINAGATRIGASGSIAIVTGNKDATKPGKLTERDIAAMIDHSLLRPELTKEQVIEGCKLAKEYDVASVCVKPCDVAVASEVLKGTNVLVTTVIGFPHGSHRTETKVYEAELAMNDGAVELDMVLNIGRLLSREFDYVEKDIKAVVDAAHKRGAIVKVILENYYLTDELKEIVCRISERAGADFVKTSTGFANGGATVADLKLMRRVCSPKVKIKAAGKVRTLDAALAVRACGGVRFGATATKAILEEARKREAMGTLVEVTDPKEFATAGGPSY